MGLSPSRARERSARQARCRRRDPLEADARPVCRACAASKLPFAVPILPPERQMLSILSFSKTENGTPVRLRQLPLRLDRLPNLVHRLVPPKLRVVLLRHQRPRKHPVDAQRPVQMADLVLQDPRVPPLRIDAPRLAPLVQRIHVHLDHLHGTLCIDRMFSQTLMTQENYAQFWGNQTMDEIWKAI